MGIASTENICIASYMHSIWPIYTLQRMPDISAVTADPSKQIYWTFCDIRDDNLYQTQKINSTHQAVQLCLR